MTEMCRQSLQGNLCRGFLGLTPTPGLRSNCTAEADSSSRAYARPRWASQGWSSLDAPALGLTRASALPASLPLARVGRRQGLFTPFGPHTFLAVATGDYIFQRAAHSEVFSEANQCLVKFIMQCSMCQTMLNTRRSIEADGRHKKKPPEGGCRWDWTEAYRRLMAKLT